MTTPIVPSISDEQLAELESLAGRIKGWNMTDAFQEAEEGVQPGEWEWHVGRLDEEGDQYPLLHVNAHQYDSGDSELLARYYAACNRAAIQGLIARLRAAEADAKRYRFLRDKNTAPGFLCNNDRAADYANEHMACGEVMDKLIDSEMESVQCQLPPSPHN